jgi:hypothetical protein
LHNNILLYINIVIIIRVIVFLQRNEVSVFVRCNYMVAVCVTYAAYTGLCCLFSGNRLRVCVLLLNLVFCVENRVFAKSVFVVEVLVCLFYVQSPVSYFM